VLLIYFIWRGIILNEVNSHFEKDSDIDLEKDVRLNKDKALLACGE
jgi:hypothetical protein